jgi:hypothetical protein
MYQVLKHSTTFKEYQTMRLYQRLFIAAAALTLGVLGGVTRTQAQGFGVQPIWANYNVQYVNEFYNPLAGSQIIADNAFVDFNSVPDPDDGTANNIPVGFTFDYNGNTYSGANAIINVNVNGWASIGPQPYAITPNNNTNLFSPTSPNNTVAPYWGDHYYRTVLDIGYFPSQISYLTTFVPDPNNPGVLATFTVEWKDLNVNDKTNPNSIASFQLRIIQNPMANDPNVPDQRATIEFQYGPAGAGGSFSTATLVGDAVGAEDDAGFTHINALFPTTEANGDSTRLNTTARSTCWPPATCLPCRAIQLVPQGVASLSQWGDGDVLLLQVTSPNPQVRENQNLFVTLADADAILVSRATGIKLDSIEGHAAFHGDANHDGRVYNPTYGAYFYYVTSYDAAYILMYLAGKIAVLPWPIPLPVPGRAAGGKGNVGSPADVTGISVDAQNMSVMGKTVLVPITVHGQTSSALSLEMNVTGLDASNIQFAGTRGVDGVLMHSNASNGKVVLATSNSFADGATIGYLEFNITNPTGAEFDLSNVQVNDQNMPGSHVALQLAGVNSPAGQSNALDQNMPNPFAVSVAGHTTIGFDLANSENVTLRVFDMLGHEVRTLINGDTRAAGHNSIEWDGRDITGNVVPSGLYYYQIVTPDFTQTVKMQVIR